MTTDAPLRAERTPDPEYPSRDSAAERSRSYGPGPRSTSTAFLIGYALVITWFSLQSALQSDDFSIQTRAFLAPWGSPDLLLQPWGGHVMPGSFAIAQVLAKLLPFQYWPMALLIAAGLIAAAWLTRALLRDILGETWAMVVALVAILACAGTWQSATWWTAALNTVPFLIVIPLALRLHLRWLRHGRARDSWLALATVGIGLLFFEKIALLVPVIAVLTVALGPAGVPGHQRLLARIRSSLVAAPLLWLAYVVLLGAFGALYLATRTSDLAEPVDITAYAEMLGLGILGTYAPTVVGGPWWWTPLGLAATPSLLIWLSAQALVIVAVVQSLLSRAARLMWLMVIGYVVVVVTIVALGRQGFGTQVITQPRYFTDAAVLTVIVASIGYARIRSQRGPRPAGPDRRRFGAAGVILAINLLLLGAGSTIAALSTQMQAQTARGYVATALARLTTTSMPVLNQSVPGGVLWGLAAPDNEYTRFFAPAVAPDRFPSSAPAAWVLDLRGEIVPGRVVGVEAQPGPISWCGWPVTDGSGTIPLDLAVFPSAFTVALEYFTEDPGSATVALGDGTPVEVDLAAGAHSLFVNVVGEGDTITIATTSPDAAVCVTRATVGVLEPATDSAPAP